MVDIQSATAENRRGKKKKKGEKTTAAKYNGLPHWAAILHVRNDWAKKFGQF